MDSDGSIVLQLLLLVVLILINAFFAGSEIAIVSANDARIKMLADDGNKKARQLLKLLEKPSNFLAAIQIGVTLAGLLSSAAASESFADRITASLAYTGVSTTVIKTISIALITIVLSFFTLVFGELVPKRIAMKNPEKISLRIVGVIVGIENIFKPFIFLLSHSTNAVGKLFGVDPNDNERTNVTEEEIRMMVDVGEESGAIEETEKEMINNVFEFNDRTASDVMTHRTDIYAVEDTSSIDDIVKVAMEEGFSRIPVFKEDLDDIVGIIYVKDLLKFVGTAVDKEFSICDLMRPPLIVPKTKRCQDLFLELTEKKQHMAVVIDEYGGTAGLVTMEDVLEAIVGSIQDEYDNEAEEYAVIDDSTYTIDGTADLDEVDELLETKLPEGEYDTLAGLIIDRIGRIPNEEEHPTVDIGDFIFTVEKVDDRRIEQVRAVRKEQPEGQEDNDKDKEE